MGGGARSDSVVGTPEVIDGSNALPEDDPHSAPALDARISTMGSFPQMGPPDLVYVRKRFRPVVGQAYNYGFYHFIRGADASSPGALASYMYALFNAGLDPAPWLATGSWEIVGATIHCYNAIAQRDAVVEISLPGGVSAFSVGPDGQLIEAAMSSAAQEAFWKETAVCAVARAIANVGEMPPYPCMRAVAPLPNPGVEDAFLAAAAACIRRWHLTGTDRPGVEAATTANSRIACAIAGYFMADCRYERAQAFFDSDPVLVADPETGALAAHAANKAGRYDDAARITSTVLELNAQASQAWLARSETLLAQGDAGGAMAAAHKATEYAPSDLVSWIALANLYVASGDHESAMVALNSANMPPPPLDPFLRELVPNRRNLTTPVKGGDAARSGAVRALSQRLREERGATPAKADDLLADLPSKLMTKPERDVYAVLVKIQDAVGWDELLSIRGRCFVMESDIADAGGITEEEDEEDSEKADEDKFLNTNPFEKEEEDVTDASKSEADGEPSSTAGGPSSEVDASKANGVTDSGPNTSASALDGLSSVSLADPVSEIVPATTSETEDKKEGGDGEDGEAEEANGGFLAETYVPSWSKERRRSKARNGTTDADGASASGDANGTDGDEANGDLPISQTALEDIGKRVCKPWLDYLVTNLYEDLRAQAVWKAEEDLHRKAATVPPGASSGEAAAAAVREDLDEFDTDVERGVPYNTPKVRTGDDVAETTRRPPVDWLRRGELALRLNDREMATLAFLVCVRLAEKAKGLNVSAAIGLMQIAAEDGNPKSMMRFGDAVWSAIDAATEYQAKQKTMDAYSEPAPLIRNALHVLISKIGLNQVRSQMPSRMDINYSRMEGLLLDAVVWKVHGYNR